MYWARVDDTDLGREKTDGAPPINNNAVDMMLLCCIQQLENMDDTLAAKYEETKEWAVKWLLKHEQVGPGVGQVLRGAEPALRISQKKGIFLKRSACP